MPRESIVVALLAASCATASTPSPITSPPAPSASTTSAMSGMSAIATPPPAADDPACVTALADLSRGFPLPISCVDAFLRTTPASNVTKLNVEMKGDEPTGLAPLEPLVALRDLTIHWKLTPDVAPLKKLVALETVSIEGDITFAALAPVAATWTYVCAYASDVEALSGFPKLEAASVGCLEPDARFDVPTLKGLTVSCYAESLDLRPLATLPQLEELDIAETPAKSLAPIAGLVHLSRLDLHGTQVASLAPLAKMKHLAWLDVHQTLVTSVGVLGALPALTFLDIGVTSVASVAPLAASKSLKSLWLDGSKVSSVAPLAKIASLREVMVPRHCDGPGVAVLHALRPDVDVMAFTEGPESKDPSCF